MSEEGKTRYDLRLDSLEIQHRYVPREDDPPFTELSLSKFPPLVLSEFSEWKSVRFTVSGSLIETLTLSARKGS